MTIRFEARADGWTAHWPEAGVTLTGDGPPDEVEVHGSVLRVTGRRVRDGRLVALDAAVDLDPSTSSRLVNGYHSWDYAGVRPAAEAGHTWWGGAVADRSGGPGLAFLAGAADRLATSFRTEPADGSVRVVGMAGGAPDLHPVPESWGFRPTEATGIDLTAVGIERAEPVLITADADAMTAMERLAEEVGASMGARRWEGPPILGWESWYHYGFSVTPEVVLANARLMRERFPERFSVVQIDDGWQRAYGDWSPRGGWPADLGDLVAEVEGLGCLPGLWLAPFMVAPGEPGIGVDRPDLMLGHAGSAHPLRDPLMNRHGLDATHPDSLEWLRGLGAQVRAWGFRMVKLDFLYIGAQEGRRHDGSMTGTQALRAGLRAFVDGVGDDVYVLGCGMPYLPAVGICHGNRIGGDLAAPIVWPFPDLAPFDPDDGWAGIPPTARNVAARWWSHRRLFDNDPDVVMAAGPDDGPPYTVDEAQVLAAVALACGGPVFLADDLGALTRAKRAVLEARPLVEGSWNAGYRPDDLFSRVDEAPDPEFYRRPSRVPATWSPPPGPTETGITVDWHQRRARHG